MRVWLPALWLAMVVLAGVMPCQAQDATIDSAGDATGFSPWQRGWFEQRGIELPPPFGIGVNLIFMERDIEVTDVAVTVGNRPPESISDRASFDVANRTTLSMVRFDAWVLPFLHLYVMAGQTRTDTSLLASFEVVPPVGDPIPVVVEQDQRADGPLYGGGATLVAGHGAFFAMLDANYARSDVDLFDGTIDALLLSGRVGWHRDTDSRTVAGVDGGHVPRLQPHPDHHHGSPALRPGEGRGRAAAREPHHTRARRIVDHPPPLGHPRRDRQQLRRRVPDRGLRELPVLTGGVMENATSIFGKEVV